MEGLNLKNFVKYCLEYLKLLRQDVFSNIPEDRAIQLPPYTFSLQKFLKSGEKQKINLQELSSDSTDEIKQKLEKFYNLQRNDPYTKQTFLGFGEHELQTQSGEQFSFPLFLIPIKIEKGFERGKGHYEIALVDPVIQVNILSLANVLSENSRVQILEEFHKNENNFVIPISELKLNIFSDFWNLVKEQIELENFVLQEKNFSFERFKICLLPRVNYFLVDDLENLSKKKEEELWETSIAGWADEKSLSIESSIPKEGELYFPFPYDEWQLRCLEIIENKISVIQGPPGTGKSQTVANLLCHLTAKGKRCLFVSQKEQALKVVKDMLKRLEVKYLFAYLPDIGSISLTEEDKLDGVGPQLTSMEYYIENLGLKIRERKEEIVLKIEGKKRPIDLRIRGKKRPIVIDYANILNEKEMSEKFKKEFEKIISIKNQLKNQFSSSLQREKKLFKLFSKLEENKKTINSRFIQIFFALRNYLINFQIRKEIKSLERVNINELIENFYKMEDEKQVKIRKYLQAIINQRLLNLWREEGVKIRRLLRKFSKAFGKSKRAYKTFDILRKNKEELMLILKLFPIWIIELDDASRILPLEPGIFDYVIFDEASQCNVAYALPVMFRAKRALFVGDSEQMRDPTILFKTRRSIEEIARKYSIPSEFQILPPHEHVQSVLDMARNCGAKEIVLRNHYRSPRELIGFSNQHFYKPKQKELFVINNHYFPFKNTNRIAFIHKVKVDPSKEFSDKVNVSEAEAILEFFKSLKKDPNLKDKSVGIISFFNEQASYIRKIFEENGLKEERDNYKIAIVEGIQGDEKDIIIYSFVIRDPKEGKRRYLPLTGEEGDIKKEINAGRVNVAFSRAKLQVHCFVSLDINEFPEGIWIKKYLNYVQKYGEILNYFSLKALPFESKFEEQVYKFLNAHFPSFLIQNQVRSCGYRLDFVISNPANGKTLAIECDGPTHFEDEVDEELGIYKEEDIMRQITLEKAGWKIYHIKFSDWVNPKFDKGRFLSDIQRFLA
mgnify:CR=1 FL=1